MARSSSWSLRPWSMLLLRQRSIECSSSVTFEWMVSIRCGAMLEGWPRLVNLLSLSKPDDPPLELTVLTRVSSNCFCNCAIVLASLAVWSSTTSILPAYRSECISLRSSSSSTLCSSASWSRSTAFSRVSKLPTLSNRCCVAAVFFSACCFSSTKQSACNWQWNTEYCSRWVGIFFLIDCGGKVMKEHL